MINEQEYTVRKLKTKDIGHLSRILSKIEFNIKDYMTEVNNKKKLDEKEIQKFGFQIAVNMLDHLLKNYHKAEDDIAVWVADLLGVKKEEFEDMPIDTIYKVFQELAANNNLMDFFNKAVG